MTKFSAILVAGLLFGGIACAETTDTTLAPPGCQIGSGCDQNGWDVSVAGGTELGLAGIDRFLGAPGEGTNPGSINGSIYSVPDGANPVRWYDPPNTALWNYEFSINTQVNGGEQSLSDFSYLLTITDLTTSTTIASFDPTLIHDNVKLGSPIYDEQNSENLAYGNPGFDPTAADDYQFTLQEFTTGQNPTLVNQAQIDIQVAPEPSTITLAGLAFGVLLMFGRRRMRQNSL